MSAAETVLDVPAWFLDTDYDGETFVARQAFFPAAGAWDHIARMLGLSDEDVERLRGYESAPFEATPDTVIAVKVIDHRGNELMVVKRIRDVMRSRDAILSALLTSPPPAAE